MCVIQKYEVMILHRNVLFMAKGKKTICSIVGSIRPFVIYD